jgi:VanZ family protein
MALFLSRRFFALGLLAQLALVVLASAGAYAGVLPTTLPSWPRADLLGHAVGYGMLGFFLAGTLAIRGRPAWTAPAVVLLCAGIEEWAQRFSPRRTSCWSDFIADVVGVCLLAWLARALVRSAPHAGQRAEPHPDGAPHARQRAEPHPDGAQPSSSPASASLVTPRKPRARAFL